MWSNLIIYCLLWFTVEAQVDELMMPWLSRHFTERSSHATIARQSHMSLTRNDATSDPGIYHHQLEISIRTKIKV